ncbi:MAG: ATP-dependent DNA helicase RecG [Pseudomonadota bacterium]
MARPEILFALFAPVEGLPGLGPKTAKLFTKLGAPRVRDLLFLAPTGVVDRRLRESLIGAEPGQVATVLATLGEHRPGRTRSAPYRILAEGGGVTFEIVHFRAHAEWMAKTYPEGARRVLSGKLDMFEGRWQMPHPDLVLDEREAGDLRPFEPVYPLIQGLTQRGVARGVAAALARLPELPEWLPERLLKAEGWPAWGAALQALHTPDGPALRAPSNPVWGRLAFDELFSHQLALNLARARARKGRGHTNIGDGRCLARAARAFGYSPTGAQSRALGEIRTDMAEPTRMMRLLQGDVGAGKTWVALMALLIAVEAGGQGALMAPTEILARQHAESLRPIAEAAGVALVLLTGRDKGRARQDKLSRIARAPSEEGAGIVIGTHALMSEDVAYGDLRLVVIDEQHRFGVRQRLDLTAKAPAGADVLVMTATPIPRTLALAGYGDLDVSILDEKPPGRQPVTTALVSMDRYEEVVERLRRAITEGQRAYWVCPLVEDSDTVALVSAEARHRTLSEALGAERVALVHGQMSAEAKDAAMAAFQEGRAQVLVATTVIEVGVDVPEATIMVVEQAEQFGLAQLHQLRGRVGRGRGRSACLLMYRSLGENARARLEVMRQTEDGFAIAEADLEQRGAGDMLGLAQSGLPRFRIADLERDQGLMEQAHDEARLVLYEDPELRTPRGEAVRLLLYLMERDTSVRLMQSG